MDPPSSNTRGAARKNSISSTSSTSSAPSGDRAAPAGRQPTSRSLPERPATRNTSYKPGQLKALFVGNPTGIAREVAHLVSYFQVSVHIVSPPETREETEQLVRECKSHSRKGVEIKNTYLPLDNIREVKSNVLLLAEDYKYIYFQMDDLPESANNAEDDSPDVDRRVKASVICPYLLARVIADAHPHKPSKPCTIHFLFDGGVEKKSDRDQHLFSIRADFSRVFQSTSREMKGKKSSWYTNQTVVAMANLLHNPNRGIYSYAINTAIDRSKFKKDMQISQIQHALGVEIEKNFPSNNALNRAGKEYFTPYTEVLEADLGREARESLQKYLDSVLSDERREEPVTPKKKVQRTKSGDTSKQD